MRMIDYLYSHSHFAAFWRITSIALSINAQASFHAGLKLTLSHQFRRCGNSKKRTSAPFKSISCDTQGIDQMSTRVKFAPARYSRLDRIPSKAFRAPLSSFQISSNVFLSTLGIPSTLL